MSEDEDVTQETPTTEPATEPVPEVEAAPEAGREPEPAAPPRERSYVRVPTWVAIVLAGVVLLGGGFVLGRATAPDDDDGVSLELPAGAGRDAIPSPVPTPSAAFLGIVPGGAPDGEGVAVTRVTQGGPADDGGLEAGDVITEFDGTEVSDPASLRAAIAEHEPGDEVSIAYTRDGEEHEIEVELGDLAAEDSSNN